MFLDFGVGWPMGERANAAGAECGVTSRRLVAGTHVNMQPTKNRNCLECGILDPTLFMRLGVRVICTAATLLGTPQAMNGPLKQGKRSA